ncbi:MAG: hypothetical protein MZU95_12160 [Desulfomicrobium escambiense]|nr:hypothetical protein [Desulfomicrobium escambiense]
MDLRATLLESFEQDLVPVGLLDRFKIAGVIASWWNHAYDELKTISAQGFNGLIDGWVETIRDFVEGDDDTQADDFKPLEHKIVPRLIPEFLEELAAAEAEIERLKGRRRRSSAASTWRTAPRTTTARRATTPRSRMICARVSRPESGSRWTASGSSHVAPA